MRDVHGNQLSNGQIVGRYLTAGGKVGIEIRMHQFGDRTTYSYIGAWGAGSRSNREDMELVVKDVLWCHPRHSIDIAF